jgi:hypothetical protein
VRKTTGTYFEQVPKSVIEKILARQVELIDEALIDSAASRRRGGNNAAGKPSTKARTGNRKR